MQVFKTVLSAVCPLVAAAFIALTVLHPIASHAQTDWCRCPGGAILAPGLVNYKGNSDREMVARVEVKPDDPEHGCEAAWISFSDVRPDGTPYSFHLQRRKLRTIRESGCGESPNEFVSRIKTYRFIAGANSQSIRLIHPANQSADQQSDLKAGAKSNANLWNAISADAPKKQLRSEEPPTHGVAAPEFCRTAWVLARKDIQGHYVGLLQAGDPRERIASLNNIHLIKAGDLGQIEASNGHTAIVRFYFGGRTEKSSRVSNMFRRWYDDTGGPYIEAKDGLYTSLRARILEVQLADIEEVNDYLDRENKNQR